MIHYFFPIYCSLCKARVPTNHYLCTSCLELLPCQHEPLFFKEGIACFAPFSYEGPVRWMLKQLKFGHHLPYANLFGELMTASLRNYYGSALPDLIIPVPLHKKRLQERGFNQSLEIAKQISRMTKIPLGRYQIIRHKATKPQAQCKAHERNHNIKNAFLTKKVVKGEHIILLDDVITTGSTLLECYHTLKKTGISRIDLWAVARTP